jgi:translation elongation factor P/translation initiation factor 5A
MNLKIDCFELINMDYTDIKVGKILLFNDEYVCKITQVNTSKTGKHGHMKKSCMGTDIFSGNKHNDLFTHHSHVTFPEYWTKKYLVINVDDEGYLDLMNEESADIRSDLKMPEGSTVVEEDYVLVATATWGEHIKECIIIKDEK